MQEFLNYSQLKPWERTIVDRYPNIYLTPNPRIRDFYGDKYEELISNPEFTNLRYGFEFESGWADLVDRFSAKANSLVNMLRGYEVQSDAYIHSCIFKQKMSRLTFQGDVNLVEPFLGLFWAYVHEIERESGRICELSGKFGVLCKRGGNLKTLSQEQALKSGYTPVDKYYQEAWKKSE
jgi:hypothetical protein